MEKVRRSGDVGHDHVEVGAALQEALQTCAGVFGPLAFVTMGQQERQTRHAVPLTFRCGNKLVNNGLGAVEKVAKLGFPNHQIVGVCQRVPILKAHHRKLRQKGVVDVELALGFFNIV